MRQTVRATPIYLPHFSRTFLIRALGIWALARVLIGFAGAYAAYQLGSEVTTESVSAWAEVWLIAGTALASYAWMWRSNEIRFLRVLGVPPTFVASYAVGPPLVLEVAYALLGL